MKTFVFTMVTVLLLAKSSFARIGDTEAVTGQRYGKPLKSIPGDPIGINKGYHAKGYVILVTYLNGKSVSEMFIKDGDARWTDAEINQLLHANMDVTQRWEPHFNANSDLWGFVNWVRSDNKLEATYYLPSGDLHPHGALVISDKAYSDAAFGWHYRKPAK